MQLAGEDEEGRTAALDALEQLRVADDDLGDERIMSAAWGSTVLSPEAFDDFLTSLEDKPECSPRLAAAAEGARRGRRIDPTRG